MLLKGLPALKFFLRKPNTYCLKAGLLAQPNAFHLPIVRQWYIEMLFEALQLREQPPYFTGFPFNSSHGRNP
jgi:hypothetical protein